MPAIAMTLTHSRRCRPVVEPFLLQHSEGLLSDLLAELDERRDLLLKRWVRHILVAQRALDEVQVNSRALPLQSKRG